MLGLRTREGVLKADIERYARLAGVAYEGKFKFFLKEGFLSQEKDRYQVTPKGFFVLNGILETLMV
jgi:coproporphyrinogen III oxidase-like Fe-S oxidoreductase